MKDKELTKRQIKLIAKIWVGSLAFSSEGGFLGEDVNLTESELESIVNEAQSIGIKLCGKYGTFGELEDIVNVFKK